MKQMAARISDTLVQPLRPGPRVVRDGAGGVARSTMYHSRESCYLWATMNRWTSRLFNALVALAILQTVYYYPRLPEVVASHWDGLGAPNAWSGRNGFFGLYLAMIALLVVVFVWAPRWSERRPRFGLKIPHADYWFAPERIEQTRRYFRSQMRLIGVVHLLLAIFVMQLAIQANFSDPPRLHPSIAWALVIYFVVLIAWLIHFFFHFRRP